MNNPVFVDKENILLVQDEDYDDYRTPDTSRVDETSFTVPDTTEATSTLRLREKIKRDKLTALYRPLNVTGKIDLIDLGQFRLTTDKKKRSCNFHFYKGDRYPSIKQANSLSRR